MMIQIRRSNLLCLVPGLVLVSFILFLAHSPQPAGLSEEVRPASEHLRTEQLRFRRKHPVIPLPEDFKLQEGSSVVTKVLRNLKSGYGCSSDEGESWASVGKDREWGLVFVDHAPGERRSADIVKLLPRTKVMVVHDTQQPSYKWPKNWADRRSFTDTVGGVGTTLLQGDLDKDGKLFDKIVAAVRTDSALNKEKEAVANSLNPDKAPYHDYGTHLHLLLVAASVVVEEGPGDLLEMGAGLFSTAELHKILENEKGGDRMLISADADFTWLQKLMDQYTCEFHQFLLIPVYTDLASCRATSQPQISEKDARLLGLST